MWITAAAQTAGHGRRGRAWSTGAGNLAATLLTTSHLPPAEAAQVSFVAALAAADLADACLGPGAARLKWPNDVLLYGAKAVGVLVESGTYQARLWLAVGIGANLAQAPQGLERPATAFADHMAAPPPAPLDALEVLAAAFERWRVIWAAQGFAPIAAAWTARAQGLGERCEARLPDRNLTGMAEGLDPDGALRLRLDDGTQARITAGDVFFGGA